MKIRNFIDNLISYVITTLIVVIIVGTIYFALDAFGIMNVPEKFSLVHIIYSKLGIEKQEVIIEEPATITREELVKNINSKLKEMDKQNTNSTGNNSTGKSHDLLDALSAIEEENKENNEEVEVTYTNLETITDVNSMAMYYDQLDEYGKIIYNRIYDDLENLKTGTYTFDFGDTFKDLLDTDGGSNVLDHAFQCSVNAITFDNPELFYIDITKMYLMTETITRPFSKTYRVTIGAKEGSSYLKDDFINGKSIEGGIIQVEQIKDEIVSNIRGMKEYDQIKYVHDYLVDNTEYDSSNKSTMYDIYGTLVDHKCVCEGYARTYKYIIDDLGIPCIIVCGIGLNSSGEAENHAWNYVKMNNKWYVVDCTWDDPIIIGGGRLTDTVKYRYFLKGSNTISGNHFEDGNIVDRANFKYPKLSVEDY